MRYGARMDRSAAVRLRPFRPYQATMTWSVSGCSATVMAPGRSPGKRRSSGTNRSSPSDKHRVLTQELELHEHADRDEEQRNEHVAERQELRHRLVAVVGLRDDEARQERPQGERRARRRRSQGREGPDQDDRDQEQLRLRVLRISARARGTTVRASTSTL